MYANVFLFASLLLASEFFLLSRFTIGEFRGEGQVLIYGLGRLLFLQRGLLRCMASTRIHRSPALVTGSPAVTPPTTTTLPPPSTSNAGSIAGGVVGASLGFAEGVRDAAGLQAKLKVNRILNRAGQRGAKSANALGGLSECPA